MQIYLLLIYFSLFGMILISFSLLVWLLKLLCIQRNSAKSFIIFFSILVGHGYLIKWEMSLVYTRYFEYSLPILVSLFIWNPLFFQTETKNFISHQLLQLGCIENFKSLHLLRIKKKDMKAESSGKDSHVVTWFSLQ